MRLSELNEQEKANMEVLRLYQLIEDNEETDPDIKLTEKGKKVEYLLKKVRQRNNMRDGDEKK